MSNENSKKIVERYRNAKERRANWEAHCRIDKDTSGARDPNLPLYTLVAFSICQINRGPWVSAWSDQSVDWAAVQAATRRMFEARL